MATIRGTQHDDYLNGTAGNDTILGLSGDDSLHGHGGNDFIQGNGGDDLLDGGTGSDVLNGGFGDDILLGAAGNDQLIGFAGDDQLDGGGGDDLFLPGAGSNTVDGGSGNDTVAYTSADIARAVDVNLATGTVTHDGGRGMDHLSRVENVIGSGFDDHIIGDAHGNLIDGFFGADVLTGGGGSDRFAYADPRESGPGAGAHDLITDFQQGADRLDLSALPAPEGWAFVGRTDHLTGGHEIGFHYDHGQTLVEASTGSDATADLEIALKGRIDLTQTDFIL